MLVGCLVIIVLVMFGWLYLVLLVIDFLVVFFDVCIELLLVDCVVDLIDEGIDFVLCIGVLLEFLLVVMLFGLM